MTPVSVPLRWVPYEAFRGNTEGLDGFPTNDQSKPNSTPEGNEIMTANLNRNSRTVLTVLLVCLLALVGCGSDSGTVPQAAAPIVPDTAPPAVPTGLAAAAHDSQVKVAWLPNTTDSDFAGFMLYRLAFGQVWPLVDAPITETSYLDKSPLRRPCKYAVTSIDEAGNESAWQEVYFSGMPDYPDLDAPR